MELTSTVAAPAPRSFAFHRNVTFLALVLGYMGYYLCRQNLSAAQPLMERAGLLSKADYGALTSFGTLLYAIGKVASGPEA